AAASAWNGGALDLVQLCIIDAAAGTRAHRLEYRHDVGVAGAGTDGAAIDKHRRTVHARDGHRAAGDVLVAAADGHEAIEALGAHHGLDRIGDHLARHQRIAHAR